MLNNLIKLLYKKRYDIRRDLIINRKQNHLNLLNVMEIEIDGNIYLLKGGDEDGLYPSEDKIRCTKETK